MTDPQSDISSKPGSSGWHIALGRASGNAAEPYLGDIEQVGAIVRALISGICDRFDETSRGELSREDAGAAAKAECERLGRVFTGKEQGYRLVGSWNDGGGLAQHVRTVLNSYLKDDAFTDDTVAVAQTFAVLVHCVYEVITKLINGGDEDDARLSLNALADDWTNLMMGIVPVDEDETTS